MKVIGITGGIGSGKSTVSAFLRANGHKIIDADAISRDMTAPGGSALPEIRKNFGDEYFRADGSLNREKLAGLVFTSASDKKKLEDIVTRKVIQEIKQEINDLRDKGSYAIIFVDAPLLYETGADCVTDLVWLVTADLKIRISRVMSRDGVTEEEVLKRMKNQMSDAEKAAKAQEIIDNSNGRGELAEQIESLLNKYARTA